MVMAGKSDPEVVIDTQQRARRIRELRGEYDEMVGSGRPSPEGHFGAGAVEDAAADRSRSVRPAGTFAGAPWLVTQKY
jgi:hypothetical protein